MTPDVDPRVAHTRDAVVAAVVELLTTEGPAAVTHARVAEQSGVSRATVYRHWPDRTALVVDAIKAHHQALPVPERTGDLETDLRALLHRVPDVMNDQELMPLFVAMLPRLEADPELGAIRDQLTSLRDTPAYPILEHARDTGQLPADIDLEVATAELIGPIFALRFIVGRRLDTDLMDAHLDHWLHGVLANR